VHVTVQVLCGLRVRVCGPRFQKVWVQCQHGSLTYLLRWLGSEPKHPKKEPNMAHITTGWWWWWCWCWWWLWLWLWWLWGVFGVRLT